VQEEEIEERFLRIGALETAFDFNSWAQASCARTI